MLKSSALRRYESQNADGVDNSIDCDRCDYMSNLIHRRNMFDGEERGLSV